MSAYDHAVASLYRAPFGDFVQERKRLAGELKAAGEKEGAARLAKLARPPVSAWAVNQLWWQQRDAFEALVAAAALVKVGDREASLAHREALGRLRDLAARILEEAGNAASEATLRRVTTTLSAIAASGGFAPDAPGALSADRDPPGFEALGFAATPPKAAQPPKTAQPTEDGSKRRAAEAERRRVEAEAQKQRQAERERLTAQLREARALQTAQQRELSRLEAEVETAEQGLGETRALLARLEDELTNL